MFRYLRILFALGIFSIVGLLPQALAANPAEAIRDVRGGVMYWLISGDDIQSAVQRAMEAPQPGSSAKGPNFQELGDLTLPEEPLSHEIENYVWEILTLSLSQNVFSRDDPQVELLAEIGPAHIQILLDTLSSEQRSPIEMAQHIMNYGWYQSLGQGHPLRDMYVIEAIGRLAGDTHKDWILEHLQDFPDLVRVVNRKKWVEDARTMILQYLADQHGVVPLEWVEAAVQLEEPSSYDDLKALFIRGPEWYQMYNLLSRLPGMYLDDAVEQAWHAAKEDPWEQVEVAPLALKHGDKDALAFLVRKLDEQKAAWKASYGVRDVVLQHIDFEGSNLDIIRWFNQNRDALTFDSGREKFFVP